MQGEGEDSLESRVERLEARLNEVEARLEPSEAFIAGVERGLESVEVEKGHFVLEMTNIHAFAQSMHALDGDQFPCRPNGLLDPLALVRTGELSVEDAMRMLCSPRSGVEMTAKEIEKGDYTNFPWHCGGSWCIRESEEPRPMFWEKDADSKGKVIATFNNETTRAVAKEYLDRVLADLAGATED